RGASARVRSGAWHALRPGRAAGTNGGPGPQVLRGLRASTTCWVRYRGLATSVLDVPSSQPNSSSAGTTHALTGCACLKDPGGSDWLIASGRQREKKDGRLGASVRQKDHGNSRLSEAANAH